MQITRKILIHLLCIVAISFYVQDAFAYTQVDDVASEQHQEVTQATAKAKVAIQNANKVIERAREQALDGTITAQAAGKIIIEQTVLIAQAKQELKSVISQAVEKVAVSDEEISYLDYFVSGAKGIGAQIVAPFKSGYGYTELEKKIARKTIKGLIEQQEQLTMDYEQAISEKLTGNERLDLKNRYEAIIAQLNNEIYKQKVITGEEMSSERKLFWAAVGSGALLVGGALLTSLVKVPEIPQEVTPQSEPEKKLMSSAQAPEQPVAAPTARRTGRRTITLPEAKPVESEKSSESQTEQVVPVPEPTKTELVEPVEPGISGVEEVKESETPSEPATEELKESEVVPEEEPEVQPAGPVTLEEEISTVPKPEEPVVISGEPTAQPSESAKTMSLQEQAEAIGKRNATKALEFAKEVAEAQNKVDAYKREKEEKGESVDPEKLKILQDDLRLKQEAGDEFLQSATKEKQDFERKVAEEQQEQQELPQAGVEMTAEKEEVEEKELDESVVAMETAYDEEQKKNTKLINDSNALVASFKDELAKTIEAKKNAGDEEGLKSLQDRYELYDADYVNSEMKEGKTPQEIYDHLAKREAVLKEEMEVERKRLRSKVQEKEQLQEKLQESGAAKFLFDEASKWLQSL